MQSNISKKSFKECVNYENIYLKITINSLFLGPFLPKIYRHVFGKFERAACMGGVRNGNLRNNFECLKVTYRT